MLTHVANVNRFNILLSSTLQLYETRKLVETTRLTINHLNGVSTAHYGSYLLQCSATQHRLLHALTYFFNSQNNGLFSVVDIHIIYITFSLTQCVFHCKIFFFSVCRLLGAMEICKGKQPSCIISYKSICSCIPSKLIKQCDLFLESISPNALSQNLLSLSQITDRTIL